MRESSKAFQDVVRDMYVAYECTSLRTVPCLAHSSRLDALSGWHGVDLCAEGEPEPLDETDVMILGTFKATIGPRCERRSTVLRRTLKLSTAGVHLTPDAKHVENLAGLLEVKGVKPSPTPCSRATGRVGAINSCRGDGVPTRHRNCSVPRPRQVRLAVRNEGPRTGLAEQVFDDEAEASVSVLAWRGRRGTFLRL